MISLQLLRMTTPRQTYSYDLTTTIAKSSAWSESGRLRIPTHSYDSEYNNAISLFLYLFCAKRSNPHSQTDLFTFPSNSIFHFHSQASSFFQHTSNGSSKKSKPFLQIHIPSDHFLNFSNFSFLTFLNYFQDFTKSIYFLFFNSSLNARLHRSDFEAMYGLSQTFCSKISIGDSSSSSFSIEIRYGSAGQLILILRFCLVVLKLLWVWSEFAVGES